MIAPDTQVRFLKGVPFNLMYHDVRLFKNLDEQYNYFNSKLKGKDYAFEKLTYQRVTKTTFKIEKSYDDLRDCNYIMFQNGSDKIPKWYYAFIVNVEFVSPQTSMVTFQLDVMQTYMFEYELMSTYIDREHSQEYRFLNGERLPIINRLDEQLDYGSSYDIIGGVQIEQLKDIVWCIIVSAIELETIPNFEYGGSSVGGVQQALFYYTIPIRINSEYSTGYFNGVAMPKLEWIMKLFSNHPDFVGSVVSMYYTSYIPFSGLQNQSETGVYIYGDERDFEIVEVAGHNLLKITDRPFINLEKFITDNVYDNFYQTTYSKLLMYPYSIIELTDFKGNNFVLKMEDLKDGKLFMKILSCISSAPKTAIYPINYNGNGNTSGFVDFTNGIVCNDVMDIPIISDQTASYIQSNKNTINLTNKNTMDNALRGVSQNNQNNELNNAITDKQQQYVQTDMFIGAMSGALSMDLGSSVNSVYSGIKQYDMNEANRSSMNMNNTFANQNLMINAEQSIAMNNAKIQDINNIPPTVSNLGNNCLFDLGNGINGYYLIYKTIKQEYRERLSNFFNMFGYKVHRVGLPNINTRKYWNYIKTIDCKISADIPQEYVNALKGIFDKGLTFWHDDDVGNYNRINEEVYNG